MNWFNGPIANAINESKTKKLIFLVYSHDSNSTETDSLWNTEKISKICNENCVSLKLEADSESCNLFKQIYKIESYPTTYLIGIQGSPIQVIKGCISEEELIKKLEDAIKTHYDSIKPQANEQAAAASSSTASNIVDEGATGSSEKSKSVEEKVALAKEKLRVIQERKKTEEEEKEKNSEIERRKLGQDILKAKKEKEEMELRRIAEEKRKEKLEDELAKQRIKERIQQDREEKQRKYALEKEQNEKVAEEERKKQALLKEQQALAESARRSQVARIQFRLIDGSTVNNQFDPNQTLADVRQFIANKLKEMNDTSDFSIHSTFPKREFTSEDMASTLRDLQLAPSATLLIIPKSSRSAAAKKLTNLIPTSLGSSSSASGSRSSSNSSNLVTYVSDFFSLVFLPFTIIWSIVTNVFTGSSGSVRSSQPSNASRNANSQNQGNLADFGSLNTSQETIANLRRRNLDNVNNNRRANFRDLNQERDDDENATWNGNSTQQM